MNEAKDILLVDDETDYRVTISELLSDSGYTVQEASSAFEALDYLEHNPNPKLILLDNMMPGMSGVEFCRIRNTKAKMNKVPIIMVTAADINESSLENLKIKGLVQKPFNIDQFIDVIDTFM